MIYKKGNKFYCRFQINGERKHLCCKGATTEKEAKNLESVYMVQLQKIQNGIIQREVKQLSFSKLCDLYWEYASANNIDLKHVKSKIKYFKEYFGANKAINKIVNADIIKYKKYLIETGKKPATVNKYLYSLKKMFNLAIENEYLTKNPCKGVYKMVEDNIQTKFWTIEDEQKFYSKCPEWFKEIITVALLTGLRKSNIRLLEKSWINFEQNLIQIPKTRNKGKKFIQLPMHKTVAQIFKKHWYNDSKYIFVNEVRKCPYSDQRLAEVYNEICKQAKIKNIGFHGLRHTFGTRLVEQNYDLELVRELLAHSSITTTQRYTHTSDERKIQAIDSLYSYNQY